MSQQGSPQRFRMDGQGTQSGERVGTGSFQAGGPTGPYPVGEVGQGSQQGQPSVPGSPTQQGPLFTTDQLTQIAQIFRLGLEPVVRDLTVRLDGLQAQVTRVPQEGTAALHGARPVPADPSLSSGLSSGPSRFGEMPPTSPGPVFAGQGQTAGISQVRQTQSPPRGGSPPGLPRGGERNQDSDERDGRDIFSKSEKWLPPMPTIDFSKWRNRADEVLGFSDWVQALRAWVSLGSDIFAWEISQCIGWEQEIHMAVLKPAQQTRSARLLAILIQTFKDFPRGNTMLQAYVEGVGIDGAYLASRGTSGFEGLRLLAKEFSLRSRAEASFFRTEFLGKTYKASQGVTQVTDTIRQIDVGLSRFRKMIETLPVGVSRVGLEIQTSDLTIMLLRSLPHEVRSYATLHAAGDAYVDFRSAALRFEQQQRMFVELSGSSSSGARGVHALEGADTTEEWWGYDQEGYDNSEYAQEEDPDDEWEWDEDAQMWISATVSRGKVSPKSNVKCHLCGRRGHIAKQCKADMSKVKCFHCSKFGHIGAQCPEKQKNSGNNQQKKPQVKAGKGKGKGKGKMHELTEQGTQEAATGSGEVLMPLISSVEPSDDEWKWWLIDSGAAVSVLSEQYKMYYKCSSEEQVMDTYYAANGSAVTMRGETQVTVAFDTGSGQKKSQTFRLKCCIGATSHNILSTTQLVKRGWTVVQSPGETYLWHEESNTVITDVLLWGGTPWLRARKMTSQVPALKDSYMPMEVDVPMESIVTGRGLTVGMVGAVELSTQERLRQHILRGHYPYDPHCLECQQGRGVSRAPRRDLRERLLEVQVDFLFLGTVGSQYKFLLFRHCFSGLLGVCAVSENVDTTGQHVRQILAEFGLLSGDPKPIDFRSDASDELGTTLRRAGIPREFTVNKAGPQNHDTVGSVERGVREVKEALAVLRLELGKAGVDVVNSLVGWEASSRYVVAMHNLHAKLDGTGLSGREVLRNQVDRKNAVTAMFCSRVLAETPESVNSIGRFVTAGYLYPVRNSFAHFVVAMIEGEQKFFQAKSLKLVFPIVYPLELVGRFVHATEAGPAPAVRDQEAVEIIPEDFARLPDNVQPPRHWIDAHGRTEGCSSCSNRSGRHSKKCVERYQTWLRAQRNQGGQSDQPDRPLAPPAEEPNREEDVAVAVPSVPKPGTSPGLMRIPGLPLGMEPTRHCPSCESRMVAPGVRHSADCRRKQAEFRALEQQFVAPPQGEVEDAPYSPSLGPDEPADEPADVNMEMLPEASSAPAEAAPSVPAEQSAPAFAQEDVAMDFDATDFEPSDHRLPMDISMIDVCQCSEQIRIGCLTSPDLLFQERLSVESISFSGVQHSFEEVVLCGERVKLWKPTGAVSDTTLEELDPQGTFLAMVKELKGLTQVKAGRVMKEKEALDFCKKHGIKVITCRWVTASKPEADEGVRARIVVKDFAKGKQTARQEGISSPTPSIESLRILLGAASGSWTGGKGFNLYAIDVSQAFMNSPLTVKVCVKFPSSVSTLDNEPVYLEAYKGLNGLRIASLTWVLFFDGIVKSVGIRSGLVEPCLYGGIVKGAPILVICYVDDLLVATPSEAAYRVLFEALEKKVKIRETGRVTMSGGSLKFLGRTIFREKGNPCLHLFVDETYLNSAFEEYGITRGSTAFPDLRPMIEQTPKESQISTEAHNRFRRVLGRLAWLAQTRQDLLILTALLATGQSAPRPGHENALRAVLRFLVNHMKYSQVFPSPGLEDLTGQDIGLEVYSDAGYAPMQATQRRSITGCVIVFRRVVLKCFSRHQSSVTLSSCEAELVALQSAVQEAIGLLKSLSFVLRRIQVFPSAWSEDDALDFICPILMRTDSLSGKMLLEGTDLQRRSRHIDIKVFWLRELLTRGVVKLQHVRGTINPADHFTKCLSTAKYLEYASVLGFLPFESLLMSSLMMNFEVRDSSFAGILCRYSVRQCLLCGEPVEPFSSFQEECDELDEDICESHAVFGLFGFLYRSGHSILHDCSCFGVSSPSTPPGYRAMSGAGGEMTEVDYRGDGDALTEVPTQEKKKAVKPKPKVKKMPKKTIVKKPAVKKMPRRTAATSVKQEKTESVKGKTTFRSRQTEANRKRRQAWKRRQKEAAEFFKKTRLTEEQRPMDIHEVEHTQKGRKVQKRSFNPATGRRETLDITLKESANTKMVTSFRGFSSKPVNALRCAHCNQLGHLISMCPLMSRRVSLTDSAVVLTPRGYHDPAPTEVAADDSVRPEDSVSVVAGLTAEALRAHERRLRGHSWDTPGKAAGEASEAKTGGAMAAGFGPPGPKGRPSSEPRPPSYPPPNWRPPSSSSMPPPPPPPMPAPLPPPSTPPPKEKPMPTGGAPVSSSAKPAAVEKSPGKAVSRPPAKNPPAKAGGAPAASASGVITVEGPDSKAPPDPKAPSTRTALRAGPGGVLEPTSNVSSEILVVSPPSIVAEPKTGGADPKAANITAVTAGSPARSTPKSTSAVAVSAVGLPERLVSCIACHGTGTLPMRQNRRLYRLLSNNPPSVTARSAAAAVGEPAAADPGPISHVFVERGVGTLVELACGFSSVLSSACFESRACYIGVHDNLEKVSIQDRVISLVDEAKRMTIASACDQKAPETYSPFLHVHVSLPCTGGSPLQNFSGGKSVKEHEKVFFSLLDAVEKILSRLQKQTFTVSFELPNTNRYWSHPKLVRAVQAWFPFRAVVHACAMGIEGVPGLPIKKAFRIMSSSEEFCKRLEKRFICNCDFHASFNFSDFALSEKYSRKFARYFIRTLCVLALEGW